MNIDAANKKKRANSYMLDGKHWIQRSNMNPENYKTKRKGQPKARNSAGRAKKRATIKPWTPAATPKLRQIYATKTEWAIKIMPKPKE